jgi:predicted transcriptional regulator
MDFQPTFPRSIHVSDQQMKAMRLAAGHKLGVVEYMGTRGLGSSSWARMMDRLSKQGFVQPYVHGGYEITESGRALVDAYKPRNS